MRSLAKHRRGASGAYAAIGQFHSPKSRSLWVLLFALIVAGAFFPVLVSVVVLLVGTSLLLRSLGAGLTTCLTIGLLFSWINLGKTLGGDFVWYSEHYQLLSRISLFDYLGQRFGPFTIKLNEPVYHTFSFIVSRLTQGSVPWLVFLLTLWLYSMAGYAFSHLARAVRLTSGQTVVAVTMGLLVGVTFTLTTHLVRQEVALYLTLCGYTSYLLGRKYLGIGLAVLGLLSHESALIVFTALVLWLISTRASGPLSRSLFLGFGFSFLFAIGLLYELHSRGYAESTGSIQVNPLVIGLDFLLLTSVALLPRRLRLSFDSRCIWAPALIFSGALIGLPADSVAFTRMYVYMDLFRGLAMFYLAAVSLRLTHVAIVGPTLLGLGVIYTEIRIASSTLVFTQGGIVSHLTYAWSSFF